MVQAVSPAQSYNAMTKLTPEQLMAPSQYAQPNTINFAAQAPGDTTPKKSSFLGFVTKTVVAAIVVMGGMALAAKKGWVKCNPDATKLTEKVTSWIAKTGDDIWTKGAEYQAKIVEYVTKCVNKAEPAADAAAKTTGV